MSKQKSFNQMCLKQLFRSFLLFFLLIASDTVFAQKEDVQFEHISMKDGLSMNPVIAITQDKKGFMWFGTPDGLNRYDGYNFKIFKSREGDTTAISDNFITTLAVDHNGNVWSGTLSGGLNKYNSYTGKFTQYTLSNSPKYSLRTNRIWSLLEDDKNILWIGTEKGVAAIGTEYGEHVNLYKEYPSLKALDGYNILCIFQESTDIYWFGTSNGLIRFDKTEGMFRLFGHEENNPHSLSNDIVLNIFRDSGSILWIGTLEGLNKYNPADETFSVTYFKEFQKQEKISSSKNTKGKTTYSILSNYWGNTIRCIFEDDGGMLWIGTDMELVVYSPGTGKHISFKKDLATATGINDHFIRSVFKDRSGNLWIGTMGNGLNKVNLKPKKFRLYQKKLNDPATLSENYVRAICEDREGNIWVGTLVGGLNRYNATEEKFYHYTRSDGLSENSINDNNVWALCFDGNDYLWIGTSNGLNRYDLRTKKFKYFVHDKNNSSSIVESTVRSIFRDSKGYLWVGTEGGLNRFDYTTEAFKRYVHDPYDNTSISDNTVWKITEDRSGKLWIATTNGLNYFFPETENFLHFKKSADDPQSLCHNGVRTLLIDSRGTLWVGTHSGLAEYNEQKKSFTCYTEDDGLPNGFIYGILEDWNGNIWVSTNKGLASITLNNKNIRVFDIFDGLQDYEFNTNACWKSKNGEMYFGGPGGLNSFHPDSLSVYDYPPPVEITGIKVLDRLFQPDIEITELKEMTLNYNENIIRFEFAALDFTSPSRNKYAYRMEGFNNNWLFSDNNRIATYTNLDPGEYIFSVKGTNSDGIWNETPDAIKISILPPFWKTKWFYALCLLSAFGATYIVYLARVKNLKKEKRLLEQKVKERTIDVETEKRKVEQINKELEKLSLVASKTDNAVVIANPEGTIEWVNEGLLRMHPKIRLAEELYGKNFIELSTNKHIRTIVDKCLQDKSSRVYESSDVSPDGGIIWVQSTLTPIFNSTGKLNKYIIIDTDITARKNAEEIIQEKNKDITDSILYAKRIQEAILPSDDYIKAHFPDSFVLYKPRDIVSGDFYWMHSLPLRKAGDGLLVFGIADCTGHGVPGAFMSMIGNDYLTQIVLDNEIASPAQILTLLDNKLSKTFTKSNNAGNSFGQMTVTDGMDIALFSYDSMTNILRYSGARRPVLLIRNGKIAEFKPSIFPIGGSDSYKKFFEDFEIQLEKGDSFYAFSDGFVDQFGGPNGKKFKIAQFKDILLSICQHPMEKQNELLQKIMRDWQGEQWQVDDILVMGVRV